jgi:hypothetical protein
MYRLSKTLQLWPSTEHAKEIDPPLPPSSGLRANHQVYTAAAGERRIKNKLSDRAPLSLYARGHMDRLPQFLVHTIPAPFAKQPKS